MLVSSNTKRDSRFSGPRANMVRRGDAGWFDPSTTLVTHLANSAEAILIQQNCSRLRRMLRTAAFLAALALPSVARADDPPAAAENASGWWTSFGSASLSALVERALAANLGLEERRLRLREARLDPAVPRSLLWPAHLDIEGSLSRFREQFASEDQNVSGTFALADLVAAATYDLDLAGRRAALRGAADQREAALRESGEAFTLALTAEVAATWFALVETRSQLELLRRQIANGSSLENLVQARVDSQLASRLDLLQQRVQVAETRALVPQVEGRQRHLENRLTALLGEDQARGDLPTDTALPALPRRPVIDAASLIARRPDVKEAQAKVAEVEQRARAQVATWVPTLQLFARGGLRTYQPVEFLHSNIWGAGIWGFGAQMSWPLFDGGQRGIEVSRLETEAQRLRIQSARVMREAAREIDDAVVAEEKTSAFAGELQAEMATARSALEEATARYQRGLGDYTTVVTAVRIVANVERARLAAQGQLLGARVRLHEVLAGNWTPQAITGGQ